MERGNLSWSVLIDPPLDGPRNMARDHALASTLSADSAVLRIYRWSTPTLSFGRNEPVRPLRDRLQAQEDLSFVRRPTGGRAVLHDQELTYAVIVPLRALGGVRRAYRLVNEGLLRAVRSLGVPAEIGGGGRAVSLDAGPCFRDAAGGEVIVGGRKLAGSAQVRLGGVLLQHGSLLVADGQSRLDEAWPDAGAGPRSTSIGEILGTAPSWERLTQAVVTGMRDVLAGRWEGPAAHPHGSPRSARAAPRVPNPDRSPRTGVEYAKLEAELLERYRSPSWTWRR